MLRKHKVKHLAGEPCNEWVKLHRPRSNLLPGRSCYQMTTPARKARGKIRITPKLSNDPASLVIVTSLLFHMLLVMNISIPPSHLLLSSCTSQSTAQRPEPLFIILMLFATNTSASSPMTSQCTPAAYVHGPLCTAHPTSFNIARYGRSNHSVGGCDYQSFKSGKKIASTTDSTPNMSIRSLDGAAKVGFWW